MAKGIEGRLSGRWIKLAFGVLLVLGLLALVNCRLLRGADPGERLDDASPGRDWAGYGRSNGQQHFSPLSHISQRNIAKLGLSWSFDLPAGNSTTEPIAVAGVLYFASGLSVVHAVDAITGRELWQFDPHTADKAGLNLRLAWGVRGLAWWDGRIFVGTHDGRLIALDALTGKQVWSAQTFAPGDAAYISGAPRVFDGKVLIGFGSSTGFNRGYVTAYDAASGKPLWRFYTVPGDPAKPFENPAMAMAAKTWAGDWWKYGGGGDVWNSMAYDPETGTAFIGTGSPYPWNHRVRSAGQGDNLFVGSIVALDAATGAYKWHYQTVPGDTWDFDATMDIELADLIIDGLPRKVLMQAPKNGFFYVIDRVTGKLISAQPHAKVTWASKVDLASGRPVEVPGARFPEGSAPRIQPTALGAHNWMPMATSPQTGLVYIPAIQFEAAYSDTGKAWQLPGDRTIDGGVGMAGGEGGFGGPVVTKASGSLLAWDPVAQKAVWRVQHPTYLNGGVLATGGKVVFQGTVDGQFKAYAADTGKVLWRFDAKAPIMAPPISFEARGRQYVTVITGMGMGYTANAAALLGSGVQRYGIDPRTQARRVLTFALDGKAVLPARALPPPPADDPGFVPEPARMMPGAMAFAAHCSTCHGSLAIGSGHAPDLRRSAVPMSAAVFTSVVKGGALTARGMPGFAEFPDSKVEDLRAYIRAQAAQLRAR